MSVIEHRDSRPQDEVRRRPRPYVRPGFLLSKVMNPITVAFGGKTILCVRGRTTGKVIKVPMDPPFEWNGSRYLVSPRGETHWARNLRAAGEADLRTRRGMEHIRVAELHGDERDAIVTVYGDTITCNCVRSLKLLPDPADHPVFRIEPAAR